MLRLHGCIGHDRTLRIGDRAADCAAPANELHGRGGGLRHLVFGCLLGDDAHETCHVEIVRRAFLAIGAGAAQVYVVDALGDGRDLRALFGLLAVLRVRLHHDAIRVARVLPERWIERMTPRIAQSVRINT